MTAPLRLLRTLVLPLALVGMMALGSVQSISCDMHGLGAMQAKGAHSHSGVGYRSHTSAHETATAPRHEHSPARDSSGGDCCCTCIGDCTAPAQTATVPTTPTLRVALVAAEPHRLPDAEPEQSLPTEPDRLLPFANGPPEIG
jgi:hypothetical protein